MNTILFLIALLLVILFLIIAFFTKPYMGNAWPFSKRKPTNKEESPD